jgi:hypothetical protein
MRRCSEQVLDEPNQSTAEAQVEVVRRVLCFGGGMMWCEGNTMYGVERMRAGAVEGCLRVYRAEK